MPPPYYPHPVPDPNQGNDIRANPKGTQIDELPDLGTLKSNVRAWLREIDPTITFNGWDLGPDTVLVVANGVQCNAAQASATDVKGFCRSDVLNGNVLQASYHNGWKAENQLRINQIPVLKNAGASSDYYWGTGDFAARVSMGRQQGGTLKGWTDFAQKRILINAHFDKGSVLLHEYFHTAGEDAPQQLGSNIDEGCVDFFARDVASKYPAAYKYRGDLAYEDPYQVVKQIVNSIGLKIIVRLWFKSDDRAMAPLRNITDNEMNGKFEDYKINAKKAADLQAAIAKFCEEARRLFPADAVLPVQAAPAPAMAMAAAVAQPDRHWDVKLPPKPPFRSGG